MLSQQQGHCTNEELSAYLDGQLTPEERAACEAHLRTCEQCQQALAALRATVALLHALPQPQVPRSFVLPVDTAASTMAAVPLRRVSVAPLAPLPLHAAPASRQRRRWPKAALTALRTLGAIAAVIGIFLLFSSLTLSLGSGGATTAGGAISSSAVTQPRATSGQQTPAAGPQTLKPESTPKGAIQVTRPAAAPGVMLPDLGTAAGQLQVGLFLLAIALLSFLLLRWHRTRAG